MIKARRIFIDCDGVLTDGRLTIDHAGQKLFKSFHTRDVRAIRELVSMGWEVTLVSADDWGGLAHFAEKVGAELLIERDKSSLPQPYVAVGDDAWDVPMLKRAECAFCPSDADQSVLETETVMILNVKGGAGVVAAVLRMLVDAND